MKKLIIFCIVLTVLMGCSKEEESKSLNTDTIVLRYAESEKQGTYQGNISDYFANLVKEKSKGKITIKVYHGGELGTEEQVLTQLQFGGIALGRVNLLSVTELIISFRTSFFPLINTPFNNVLNYIDNSQNFNFAFQNEKLFPLTILPPSTRCIYSDEKLISDEYQNLRIGIDNSQMYEEFLTQWGVHPIKMGSVATFPSLRNGFIDARESSISSFISSDEYPYIKEVVILNNVTLPSFIIFSNEVLNQLSKQQVELLVECADLTLKYAEKYIYEQEVNAFMKINREKLMRRI